MPEQIICRNREPQLLVVVGPFDNADLEALKQIFPALQEVHTLAEIQQEEWDTLVATASKVAEAAPRELDKRDLATAPFLFQDGGVTPFNNPAFIL